MTREVLKRHLLCVHQHMFIYWCFSNPNRMTVGSQNMFSAVVKLKYIVTFSLWTNQVHESRSANSGSGELYLYLTLGRNINNNYAEIIRENLHIFSQRYYRVLISCY